MKVAIWILVLILCTTLVRGMSKRNRVPPNTANLIQSPGDLSTFPAFPLSSSFFPIAGLFEITTAGGSLFRGGIQQLEAFRYQINQINGNSSFLRDYDIVYSIYDAQDLSSVALSSAINILGSNFTAVVGPGLPDSVLTTASFLENYNISTISYAAPSFILDNAFLSTFTRVSPNDNQLANAVGSLLRYFDWTLVMPVFTNDTFGSNGRTAISTAGNRNRLRFTCTATLPTIFTPQQGETFTSNVNSTAVCIAGSFATVVVLWMDPLNAANLIGYLYNKAGAPQKTFIFVDSAWKFTIDPASFAEVGNFPISYLKGSIGVVPAYGDVEPFRQHFYTLNPSNSPYEQFIQFWQRTFSCYYGTDNPTLPICSDDISARTTNPISCKCTGRESLDGVAIDHDVGYIQDAVSAYANALNVITTNCEVLREFDYCSLANITGYQLFSAMEQSSFYGTTGLVEFANSTRANPLIEYFQLNSDGTFHSMGNYSVTGGVSIDNSTFAFNTEDGQPPISAIVPEDLTFTSAWGVTISLLAGLLIVICVASMVYFYINREEKVIKKSSPVFCQLILFGIIMVNASLIIWTIPQTQFTCILKIWILCVGFALIMGNLLAKTYRIFKIFTNVKVSTSAITDLDLLKFSGAVIFLEVILLIIYTFGSGTLPDAVVVNSTTNSLYSYISCQIEDNEGFQTAMTIIIIAFNEILVILGAIIAYLTRNVDSAFNESAYIGATMYCYIFLSVIFLALYYTNGDSAGSASRRYVERSFAILAAMAFTFAMLFGPKFLTIAKIYFVEEGSSSWSKKKKKKRMAGTSSGLAPSASDMISSSRITEISDSEMMVLTSTSMDSSHGVARYYGAGETSRVAKANEPPPRFLSSSVWAQRKARENAQRLGVSSDFMDFTSTTGSAASDYMGSDTMRRRRLNLGRAGILGYLENFEESEFDIDEDEEDAELDEEGLDEAEGNVDEDNQSGEEEDDDFINL